MKKEQVPAEEKKIRMLREQKSEHAQHDSNADNSLVNLQKLVGNRAVQRLLAQRSSEAATSGQSFDVDDETAERIEKERGRGQDLESGMQQKMGAAMGYDFSQVNVHTSTEADALNRQLGAEAFTTGNDIYFREGAYDPQSTGGQELLTHEMAHVVQQSNGQVGGGTKMTVNAPDDSYEKKADAVAHEVTSAPGAVQKEEIQMQAIPEEEEELQTRRVQRQENSEEEEMLKKGVPEEEELQMRRVQRQEGSEEEEKIKKEKLEEEEEIQTKRIHRRARGKKY